MRTGGFSSCRDSWGSGCGDQGGPERGCAPAVLVLGARTCGPRCHAASPCPARCRPLKAAVPCPASLPVRPLAEPGPPAPAAGAAGPVPAWPQCSSPRRLRHSPQRPQHPPDDGGHRNADRTQRKPRPPCLASLALCGGHRVGGVRPPGALPPLGVGRAGRSSAQGVESSLSSWDADEESSGPLKGAAFSPKGKCAASGLSETASTTKFWGDRALFPG